MLQNLFGFAHIHAFFQARRRAIEREEAAKRREALNLSTDDSDIEDFVPARQRKKEKVYPKRLAHWLAKITTSSQCFR